MAKNLKFKPIAKDQLFYGRWQYCISFNLEEISCLKELDHDYINRTIEDRREWRESSKARLTRQFNNKRIIAFDLSKRWRDITDEIADNLHKLADQLINTTVPFKLVTGGDQGWVYSNNLELIKSLNDNPIIKYKQLSEAVVDRPKNSIRLKNVTHTHRSYFKHIKISAETKTNLVNFFANQTEHIRTSPALKEWLTHQLFRTQDYFFIDHNGESWLLMLALVKSGLIRKTVDIIPA